MKFKEELFIFWHLTLPCWLWKLRGLPSCPHHGFQAQSWITGDCRKCTGTIRLRGKRIYIIQIDTNDRLMLNELRKEFKRAIKKEKFIFMSSRGVKITELR